MQPMQSDPLQVESHINGYFSFLLLRAPELFWFPSLICHIIRHISQKAGGSSDDVPTISLLESRAKRK